MIIYDKRGITIRTKRNNKYRSFNKQAHKVQIAIPQYVSLITKLLRGNIYE